MRGGVRLGKLAAHFGREGDAPLERRLAAICAEARAAWPGVALDDEAFAAHLAARAPDGALDGLHTRDLFLACACARGAPGAIAAFEQKLLARLPSLLAPLRLDRAALEDARQAVLQRLLVPRPDGPPRIAEYAGRGPLEGWLRISAIRCALNAREQERVRVQVEEDSAAARRLLPAAADAELQLIRERHQGDVAAAFRAALGELTARERALLALHFLQNVPTALLAPMYGVHRTTVGRWIDGARETLLAATRRHLSSRLRLDDAECDSLIALLGSQLDVSLRGALDPTSGT